VINGHTDTDTEPAGTIDIVLIPIGKRPINKLLAINLSTGLNRSTDPNQHTTTAEVRDAGVLY
jgi:hypothetical protein